MWNTLTWKAAKSRGVLPVLSLVFTSAPWSIRFCTAASLPLTQAQQRAVRPSLSLLSKTEPLSKNNSIKFVWPSEAANINAVRPAGSRWSRRDAASSRMASVLLESVPVIVSSKLFPSSKKSICPETSTRYYILRRYKNSVESNMAEEERNRNKNNFLY